MVYASQQLSDSKANKIDIPVLIEPSILQAARHIYRTYYEVNLDDKHRPLGVAVDRYSLRGKLIFTRKPILLPQECFVPIQQIDLDLY